MFSTFLRLLSIPANGLEPAIGKFGLQRIVVEWVIFPKILLPESDDVKLLAPARRPVPGLVLGDEVFVSPGGDRAAHAPNIHLSTSVEQVWQILHANAIADIETGGSARFRVSGLFIASLHLCNLFEQLGQRNVVLVDEHPGCGPNPASVIGEAEIER